MFHGTGGYTNQNRQMMMVVARQK
ncbi:DUF2179 domain-containing protein [Pontibacillus litoralis]|nr:DUF2179 domain-containing protein [Pontibacillus litoralis]